MERDYMAEWFQYASIDMASAEHLANTMRPQPLEIICFLCQQSAEKNLKGYLLYKTDTEPSKTHDFPPPHSRIPYFCLLRLNSQKPAPMMKITSAMPKIVFTSMPHLRSLYAEGVAPSDILCTVLSMCRVSILARTCRQHHFCLQIGIHLAAWTAP